MGKNVGASILAIVWAAGATFAGSSSAQVTVSYTGPAVAIPDGNSAGVNISLPVSGVGTITDVNFRLDAGGVCNATVGLATAAVDHTFVGDLRFRLTSPTGTSVVVFDRRGGTRENYCNTVIDDDGRYVLGQDVSSLAGFSMAGAFAADNALAAFDGQNANGTWILNVSDNAGIDTGSLRRFSLVFNSSAPTALIYAYDIFGDRLVSFTADRPSVLLTDVALTGLGQFEDLIGVDFRPVDGALFGMGDNLTNERLLRINIDTGVTTQVPPAATPSPQGAALSGFDFDPSADRVRVVDSAENNRRIDPFSGAIAAPDTPLAYVAGDPGASNFPNVVHTAYSNSFPGATATTLYGIDDVSNTLVRIGGFNGVPSPNLGQITTIGSLGVNVGGLGGFDVQPRTNLAFAALQVGVTPVSVLHLVNLTTGAATVIGPIGTGTTIDGLAIRDGRSDLFVDGFE